jgi:hypothetical protein
MCFCLEESINGKQTRQMRGAKTGIEAERNQIRKSSLQADAMPAEGITTIPRRAVVLFCRF